MKKLKVLLEVVKGNSIVISKVDDKQITVFCGKQINRSTMINSLASALKSTF